MNIDGYRFGRIDIDGRTYTSDVIVTPEHVLRASSYVLMTPRHHE